MADTDACPFCSLEEQRFTFAEFRGFHAFHNVAPILPGHVLVVPDRHVESLMELDDAELGDFFHFARTVTKFVVSEFKGSGFDWSIQEGGAAGQSIRHLHLHVIPRHVGDLANPGDWYPRLVKSPSGRIDDAKRPRLTDIERMKVVTHLKYRWSSLP